MNLLISAASKRLIADFAKSIGGRVDYSSLKVAICAVHVSIVFSQPERYSRLINCEFRFSPDVSFFYEEVCAAFRSSVHPLQMGGNKDEMERNDDYIAGVIEFCNAHWAEIIALPPPWYEKAVEISDKNTRTNFPEIADEDLGKKARLLKIWLDQLNY